MIAAHSPTPLRPLDQYLQVLGVLVAEGTDIVMPVTGNSMLPVWRDQRDSITLTACRPEALHKGDVPLYRRSNGQPVVHRIVKVRRDSFDFCGDAQTAIEYRVPKSAVIAVVKSFTRQGRAYAGHHRGYRLYTQIWLWLRPWRAVLLAVYRRLGGRF